MTASQTALGPIANATIPLPKAFEDSRGKIQTLVDKDISSVQVITSKAGSVRANHWHKADSHYMYVVSGKMKYFHRAVGDTKAPDALVLAAGEMVFTPSHVEHAVEFLEDTMFLNITSGARDQSTYENDIVRVELIKPKG